MMLTLVGSSVNRDGETNKIHLHTGHMAIVEAERMKFIVLKILTQLLCDNFSSLMV